MECFFCAKSFRGRSRKIPCTCGCDRFAHLGCVPGLSKDAAKKRKNGEPFVFQCKSCVTSIPVDVRRNPVVVLVRLEEVSDVNQLVCDGPTAPLPKRRKNIQETHDTHQRPSSGAPSSSSIRLPPPLTTPECRSLLAEWPSSSGSPLSAFIPPPSQFTNSCTSLNVCDSPGLPPPPLELTNYCTSLIECDSPGLPPPPMELTSCCTSLVVCDSPDLPAPPLQFAESTVPEIRTPDHSPEFGALHDFNFSPIPAEHHSSARRSSFGNTLDHNDLQDIAPLASSYLETYQDSRVYGLPEEDPLDKSEQPALPEKPTWKIEFDASMKDRVLLTDNRGFR